MLTSLRLKVVEVVGLHKGSEGRTCGFHAECGRSLTVPVFISYAAPVQYSSKSSLSKP
jgi:hypothetical protein